MTLIRPDKIAFQATVTEAELRERMTQEILESIGALDENGKAPAGVEVNVKRGTGRAGGYTISVTGPAPARIALPRMQDTE